MKYAELFEKILEKPGMYVGNYRIERFRAYMDGYIHAKWEAGELVEDDLYHGFSQWVAAHSELGVDRDWVSIINFMSFSDEMAFERTKQLWGEYKASAGHREQEEL
jgi:hypothetical protein